MKNPLLKNANNRFAYPEKVTTRGMSGVYSDMYGGGLFDGGKDFPPEVREQVKKTVFGSVKVGQRRSEVKIAADRVAYPVHFAIADAVGGTVVPSPSEGDFGIQTPEGMLLVNYEGPESGMGTIYSEATGNESNAFPWNDEKAAAEAALSIYQPKPEKKIRTPKFNREDKDYLKEMGVTGSKLAVRLHIPEDPKAHEAAIRRIARTMKVGDEYSLPHKPRLYKCLNCGHEQNISTNHTGNVLDYCHGCSWKRSWRGDGRYGDKTAPEMSFSLPALGNHTYRPFEYVGSVEDEHPLTDSDKSELKSMGVQAAFIAPTNSKVAEQALTRFAKQAAKATHVIYDAGPTSYTVRVMRGNDTIDEYNGGNSPYDSVSEFGRTDSDAIEYKRLLQFAETSAKEMAEEYGVPESMIEHNDDLMAEEREEAGMDFTSDDHGVLREMGIKGSKEASRYYPHDPRIPFSDDAKAPYGVELHPETLPKDDPEAEDRIEEKRKRFKSKMLQQGARQRDRVPVNNKKYSEDDLNYLLDWFSNMFGALKPDIRKRLMRVINNPTEKTWDNAYSIILNGEGKMTTLWQAVIKVDPWFPKIDPSEDREGKRIEGWEQIPDQKTLVKALLNVAGLNSMPTKPTVENPFSPEDKKMMEQMGIQAAAAKPKCPHCGSGNYVLMPTDFETAKCDDCGKNWNHGIVKGINDPSDKTAAQHRQWWPHGRHKFELPEDGSDFCKACDYPADHKLHTTPPPSSPEEAKKEAANCYKTPSLRGPNSITQNGAGRRMESADGSRWAISANRKRALPDHRFDSVEVWTLKRRDANGRVETVEINRSEEDAQKWVMGSKIAFFSPEDAAKFRAENDGSNIALRDIDERDEDDIEEDTDYWRWEPVFDENGKPIARTACLPCEYCPQCHKDAERCHCPNKAELLDGKTVGDHLEEETKIATPHDQEAFGDGPVDFFEPVENPHSIQPLRASDKKPTPEELDAYYKEHIAAHEAHEYRGYADGRTCYICSAPKVYHTPDAKWKQASMKTATIYKVEQQSPNNWSILGLPSMGWDNEGVDKEYPNSTIVPGLNHSLRTPEGLTQGIYEQLYDEFQVNDHLKAGDIFDTPVGQFICEGVHVLPYDEKAKAALKAVDEQFKCANCGCDQGDHRRESDGGDDYYFECRYHPTECKQFVKKVKTAAMPPPPPPPPAIVEEVPAAMARPALEFPMQVQAPAKPVGTAKFVFEPQPLETLPLSSGREVKPALEQTPPEGNTHMYIDSDKGYKEI